MQSDRAELSEGDLLERVDALNQRRRQTGVEILLLVSEFATQHGLGTVDPIQAQLPGRERAVRLGGEGTPLVAEFAPAALAARLELSAYAGGRLVADVLDLQHRLPHHWHRLQALEVDEQHARFVARKTRDLTPEEAAYVDARVAKYADGRVSWTRFETLLEAAIKAADPATAAAREHIAARETFAKTTHSTEHGIRGFYIRAEAATIARIDATVAYLAEALLTMGDDTPLDLRRTKAVLIMANPTQAVKILTAYGRLRDQKLAAIHAADQPPSDTGPDSPLDPAPATEPGTEPEGFNPARATDQSDPDNLAELLDMKNLLPTVWLFVHLARDTNTNTNTGTGTDTDPDTSEGGVARVEGSDPVTEEWVRTHLGERCQFKITPVLDPLDQIPVDAYEIPDRHKQAVHLMTPADTFPYASNTTRKMQIDHTKEWSALRAAAGEKQSRIGNYGPMVTFHHRIKTHGGWQVRQPFPGLYLWRDPYGATYLVDHTGTRRLPQTTRSPRSIREEHTPTDLAS